MPENMQPRNCEMKTLSNSLAAASALAALAVRLGRCRQRRLLAPSSAVLGSRVHQPITWMSACSAPAALIACRMEMMSRGPTPSAFRPSTRSAARRPRAARPSCCPCCRRSGCGARHDLGGAGVGEGRGLADLRRLGDLDGEIALRDGDGGDAHIRAHHDHAGVLVDDDLGGLIGIDLDLLDVGEQRHHAAGIIGRHAPAATLEGSVAAAALPPR